MIARTKKHALRVIATVIVTAIATLIATSTIGAASTGLGPIGPGPTGFPSSPPPAPPKTDEFWTLTNNSWGLEDDPSSLQKQKLPVFSVEQARALMTWFHARIPFSYIEAGCEYRAHRMARLLKDHGIASAKIFELISRGIPYEKW